jgi:hypothetical protein
MDTRKRLSATDALSMALRLSRGTINLSRLNLRRSLWRIHPRRFLPDVGEVPIQRPVFLLGVQGGGLTLTARMLRRHRDVVCVSGNAGFWAGPDEMQNIMGSYLPAEMTGLHHHVPPHPDFPERGALYAIDELLPLYRKTAADATEEVAQRFRRAMQLVIAIYARDRQRARFVDKSQTFTVRLGLVHGLLDGCDPRFILITRNPYAMCYRAAVTTTPISRLPRSEAERFTFAAQHWHNSFRCALEDAGAGIPLLTLRFEDLLCSPETWLRRICDFAALDFHPSMLPAPTHRLPLGSTNSSRGDRKWYPLRPDVNHPYLERLQPWMVETITRRTGELAERWGYTPEGP